MDTRFGKVVPTETPEQIPTAKFAEENIAQNKETNTARMSSQISSIKKNYNSKLYSAVVRAVDKIKHNPDDSHTDNEKFFYAVVKHYAGCSYYQLAMCSNSTEKTAHLSTALKYLKEADVLFESLQKSSLLENKFNLTYYASNLSTLGECQKELGYWSDAIVTLKKALDNFLVIKSAMEKSLDELKDYQADSKKENSQLSQLIQQTEVILKNANTVLAKTNLALGQIYTWNGKSDDDYLLADQYLLAARQYSLSEHDQLICFHFLGMCNLKRNNLDKAIEYLQQLAQLAKENNFGLYMDATLGLGLCEGVKSHFASKDALQKLATAYTFYQWNKVENTRDLPTCRGVVKQWLNSIKLPPEEKQPNELQLLFQMISVSQESVVKQNYYKQHQFI